MALLDPELLAMLVCPVCREAVTEEEAEDRLVCSGCGRAYPVRDGIPDMVVEVDEPG